MTDTSILDDDAQIERNDSPVFRNGVLSIPDTPAARRNLAALLRACQDVGYSAVGAAVLHDKSWVCRLLKGEAVANLYEWLWVMEATSLRIQEPNAENAADAELLVALLNKTSATLNRSRREAREGDVRIPSDEYNALLMLSLRGVKSMQEAHQC